MREAGHRLSEPNESNPAWIGLRSKTARAIAVVLSGSPGFPIAIVRTELVFGTAATPAHFQPFHEVMDLPWEQAQAAAAKAERALGALAADRLKAVIADLKLSGATVRGIGIVGAPERSLRGLGSPHIRAHAAEGLLFRRILEHAASARGVDWRTFNERTLDELAERELGLSGPEIKAKLAEFGQRLGRPWRTDEKAAALAAWLAAASISAPS